jgi:NAD(P)H-nitrite reductase large subunit
MSGNQTMLCRCECIPVSDVETAIAEGNLTINDVKRRTRAGMGFCQGIYCVGAIAELLLRAGVLPEAIEAMTARPPTRLIPVGIAASLSAGRDE